MLKRISIQHLTLGMYLHDFCGSWMDHPFWRAKFVLKDPKDLARIKDTAIEEVWIDISKGLDVAAGVRSISREEADIQVETDGDGFLRWLLDPIKIVRSGNGADGYLLRFTRVSTKNMKSAWP